MEADVRFFQVTAAAIPTLFIALAISAKTFHPGEKEDTLWTPRSLDGLIGVAVALCAFAVGEMISLAVLVLNKPTFSTAFVVGAIVWFQLLMLIGTTLSPAMLKFRPEPTGQRVLFGIFLTILMIIPQAVFVLIIRLTIGR